MLYVNYTLIKFFLIKKKSKYWAVSFIFDALKQFAWRWDFLLSKDLKELPYENT